MKEKAYTIYNTPEYDEWLDEQTAKSKDIRQAKKIFNKHVSSDEES